MAHIFKVKTTKPLPPKADVVDKNGKRFVRLKRKGRSVLYPLTECGTRYTQESRKWYIQYRDATGSWRRVAGYTDKDATSQRAAELERKAEHIQSGLADPHETGKLAPLTAHLREFRSYLKGASNSPKHVSQSCMRIERLLDGCGFTRWTEIVPSAVVTWLAAEREAGRMGVKTSNYYLAAIKQFCTWLEEDGKVPKNQSPVDHLAAINAEADVRWKRRAISTPEFARLIAAAETGPDVQCVSGSDRAMLYILAAWTGYRREELASLTLKSFELEASPPTVRVQAGYSKRRKNDVVPLHPAVVERFRAWLARKGDLPRDEPLFNLRAPKGSLRRTAKMMRLDLARARAAWIKEAEEPKERKRREESDFLHYQNENGLYADFHANRHTFISNLALAGVSPKLAQSVARHSDVNLTLGVYSHVEISDQAAAISALPAPPPAYAPSQRVEASEEKFAHGFAQTSGAACHQAAWDGNEASAKRGEGTGDNPLPKKQLVILCHALTPDDLNSGGGTRTPDTRIMIPLL